MARKNMRLNSKNSQSGFTLIELLVSVAILAFISASVWSSLYSLSKTKERVEDRDDFQQMTRIVMDRLSRDLSLAFIIPQAHRWTGFVGTEDTLTFTTLSHSPVGTNIKECDETLINYSLERDYNKPSLYVLKRKENKRLNGDFSEDETKSLALIKGVSSFKLGYYDGEKFIGRWDHDSAETKQKNKIPRAVKVNLEVKDDHDREHHFYTMINIPLSRIEPTYFNPPSIPEKKSDKTTGGSGGGAESTKGGQKDQSTGGATQAGGTTQP